MKPRSDAVGLILSRDEADLAIKLDEAARAHEVLSSIEISLRSTPIGIELNDHSEEYILDEAQSGRLWSVAFWATTRYLAGYREITAVHEEICQNDDIRRDAIAQYLFGLEIMMKLEADHYETAKQFALDVDRTRDWSRSHVLSENKVS